MLGRNLHEDKQRSKSNQRRKLKSPIRIKEKIKELEGKLEKQAIFKELLKRHKSQEKDLPPPIKPHTPKQQEISPFKKIERNRAEVHSSDKYGNSIFSTTRQPIVSKKISEKEEKESLPARPIKVFRRQSERDLPSRLKQLGREQESLQRLKVQNDKYKQIYSKSQQKMQELQYVLNQIKGKHQSEKFTLRKTIDNLQKKIEEKKISLGHLYSYDEKGNNFLMVQDKIIAETDNENSTSPPQVPSKRNSNLPSVKLKPSPEFSNLSLESK